MADAPVNETETPEDRPAETTPPAASLEDTPAEAVIAEAEAVAEASEQPAASEAVAETPAEEPAASEAKADSHLPEELQALAAVLEQPTGELMALPETASEAQPAEGVTVIAEPAAAVAETAVEAAPAEEAAATAEAQATEEPAAEGATFDDIAPGTVTAVEGEEAAAEDLAEAPARSVPGWPFAIYDVAWIAGAAYFVSQLRFVPSAQGVYEANLYSVGMIAGLSMLIGGPILLLLVWAGTWIARRENARPGSMFISALMWGSGATLLGAITWIVAIMLIDYLRFGRAF